MDSLYVYYRTDPARRDLTRQSIAKVMAQVAARTGIHGRLMERADDATTWMEIYENVGDIGSFRQTFDEIVSRAELASLLASVIDGQRHVEHFRDHPDSGDPCA